MKSLGTVSVVMMALETFSQPLGDSLEAESVRPWKIFPISRKGPMTPVDMTRALPRPRSLALAMVASASCSPFSPVQALAQPLLITTADTLDESWAKILWETNTGAARNLLVVKTAAAELDGGGPIISHTHERVGVEVIMAVAVMELTYQGTSEVMRAKSRASRCSSTREVD